MKRVVRLASQSVSVTVAPAQCAPPTLPLLCMCGALGTADTDWAPQLRGLPGLAVPVVSLDPRGYGASQPPCRSFPSDFYTVDADDATAVMDELGHKRFALAGWSDGANAAMLLAARNPERVDVLPERVASLVVLRRVRNVSSWCFA